MATHVAVVFCNTMWSKSTRTRPLEVVLHGLTTLEIGLKFSYRWFWNI